MFALEDDEASDCLLGRSAPMPGYLGARIADRTRVYWVEFCIDDVVLCGDEVAKIEACCQQSGELFACVRPCTKVSDVSRQAGVYRIASDMIVWVGSLLVHSLAWRERSDGTLLVVRR